MLNKNKTISEMVTQSKGRLNPIYSIHFQKMKNGKLLARYFCELNCVLQKDLLNS